MKKIIASILAMGLLSMLMMVTVNARVVGSMRQESVGPSFSFADIYVDDDALQGGDGSFEHPFQTIAEGINAAEDGDTVFVFSGNYDEYLKFSKSIRLIGEDREFTIIDGVNTGLEVTNVDGLTVSGFNFSKGGVFVLYDSSNCTFTNNIVENRHGIDIVNSYHTRISENIIKPTLSDGIELRRNSANTSISRNHIRSYNHGISIIYDSNNTTVTDNTIMNNRWSGISLQTSNNIISGNIITNNDDGGIRLMHGDNNIISNNIITDNNDFGIDVAWSENTNIDNNTIININGVLGADGIHLFASDENKITHNEILHVTSGNSTGIKLAVSDDNTLSKNAISNIYGSYTADGILIKVSKNNIIWGNNISNVYWCGVYVFSGCIGNHFYYNNFIDNGHSDQGGNAIDEGINLWYRPLTQEGNYWDGYDGEDSDGDGIGDDPYIIPPYNLINNDQFPLMEACDQSNPISQQSLFFPFLQIPNRTNFPLIL